MGADAPTADAGVEAHRPELVGGRGVFDSPRVCQARARKLWARTRNGHYLLNPAMQLRRGEGWQPVLEALSFDWLNRGTASAKPFGTSPASVVAQLKERLSGRLNELF